MSLPVSYDKTFRVVAAATRQAAPNLTHVQRVQRLYRKGLKLLGSWAVDRNVWLDEAGELRQQFEANRAIDPASKQAASLIEAGEKWMYERSHPDRYCTPWMPGGSKFMRNPPPPFSICDDVPEGATPWINVDMTPVRPGEEKRSLLVDFGKKNME